MNLSPNFTYEEAIASNTASRSGIENIPDAAILDVMEQTAQFMELVRAVLDSKPIHINSWFRCIQLNRAIGSKDSSQHIRGEAVDFICPTYGSPYEICKAIIQARNIVPFDQLILEHTWVHISFAIATKHPRGQVLSLLSNGGYTSGLTDKHGNKIA